MNTHFSFHDTNVFFRFVLQIIEENFENRLNFGFEITDVSFSVQISHTWNGLLYENIMSYMYICIFCLFKLALLTNFNMFEIKKSVCSNLISETDTPARNAGIFCTALL